MNFNLHTRLQQDCHTLGHFELSRLLLMNDCRYPWFILVPQCANVSEIYHLSKQDQQLVAEESMYLAETLALLFEADKMNVACLGNVVPQLHIHHIVRYRDDATWPNPVWGRGVAVPYSTELLIERRNKVIEALSKSRRPFSVSPVKKP